MGQNQSIDLIFDSIYPLVENGNYDKAKELWMATERNYKMDQQEKYLFLITALENNDVKFYKKEMKNLIRFGGYHISQFDTAAVYRSNHLDLMEHKEVLSWTVEMSEKHHPKWIQENPKSHYVRQRCDYFIQRDQNFINLAVPACDSSDSCIQLRQEHYEKVAMMEASELASFFIEIGGVANNIDYGVDVYYPLLVVCHHIFECSEKTLNYAWSLLQPYFEKARLEGKIASDIFYIYDEALFLHTGFQYYGTYGDSPTIDEEGRKERMMRFKLKSYSLN
ncbi:MAG: hypothetical protein Crog4KO_25780 [Crocinitomicaceae bacterium]